MAPVEVTGHLDSGQPEHSEPQDSHPASCQETVRIMVDISMSNGVHILWRSWRLYVERYRTDKDTERYLS